MPRKDPEKKKEYQRTYYQSRREEAREYRRTQYWANREEELARLRAYREAHREEAAERTRTWRAANKEQHLEAHRQHYRANKSYYGQKANARKRSHAHTHTENEWITVCDALNWRCACCGKQKPLTRDHVVPIKGNEHEPWIDHISNIQPLCAWCNRSKGAKTIDYRPDWLIEALQTK